MALGLGPACCVAQPHSPSPDSSGEPQLGENEDEDPTFCEVWPE